MTDSLFSTKAIYLSCKGFFNTGSFLFGTFRTDISILFNKIEEG